VTTSEQIGDIAAACAKAQLEMTPAAKDAKNPHYNSRYSDLAAVIDAARIYAKHNIAIFQDVVTNEAGASVTTRLAHASGQWIEFGPLTVPMGKRDAHGVGSATTYAKRYGLQAAALIPSEDDDGNAASGTQERKQVAPPKPEGYDDNLLTLESLTVPEARKTFANWPGSHRDYFTTVDKTKYDAFKQKGAQHDAEQRKAKGAAA
jgi:hypothetical protein